MTITLATNVTGIMDADDKRAMIARIVQANASRVPPLPWDNNVNIKASYEKILSEASVSTHLANIDLAASTDGLAGAGYSDADRAAIRKKVLDLTQSGQTPAQVLAKIAALT